jgi:RimJ/RimL family protein N-acetyltransferase
MDHTIQTEGFGVRLRPVRLDDAEFIVWVRNLPHVKGRVGDTAVDAGAQEAWLRDYFQRAGDYYFIVETLRQKQLGAYGIYDVRGASAESGRWVMRPDVPAALPNAIIAFDLAFGRLGLTELRAKTISTNKTVLSLNVKLGFEQKHIEENSQVIGGKPVDQFHFALPKESWLKRRETLLPLARFAEKQVLEWDKAQGS